VKLRAANSIKVRLEPQVAFPNLLHVKLRAVNKIGVGLDCQVASPNLPLHPHLTVFYSQTAFMDHVNEVICDI